MGAFSSRLIGVIRTDLALSDRCAGSPPSSWRFAENPRRPVCDRGRIPRVQYSVTAGWGALWHMTFLATPASIDTVIQTLGVDPGNPLAPW